jgi:hypothetical protein
MKLLMGSTEATVPMGDKAVVSVAEAGVAAALADAAAVTGSVDDGNHFLSCTGVQGCEWVQAYGVWKMGQLRSPYGLVHGV